MITQVSACRTVSLDESSFQAGMIKNHLPQWKEITSDHVILNLVQGCKIEFETVPSQIMPPRPCTFNDNELIAVKQEIRQLLKKGVIFECGHEPDEFVSNIFLRPKKNNTFRMILNMMVNCTNSLVCQMDLAQHQIFYKTAKTHTSCFKTTGIYI